MKEFPLLARTLPELEAAAVIVREGQACDLGALWGSAPALVAATLAGMTGGRWLFVCPGVEEAREALLDIRSFFEGPVAEFPAWEAGAERVDPGVFSSRLNVLLDLAVPGRTPPRILVAPVQALLQPVPTPDLLWGNLIEVRPGKPLPIDALAATLVEHEFVRVPQVEGAGEFSIRGGIVDVFAHSDARPWRIVYDGDVVETVKPFDPATQQSFRAEREAALGLVKRSQFVLAPGTGKTLLDYLAPGDAILFREEAELDERARRFLRTAPGDPGDPWVSLQRAAAKFGRVRTHTLPVNESAHRLNLRTLSTLRFSGDLKNILAELQRVAGEARRVILVCQNAGETERLGEILREGDLQDRVTTVIGHLHHGFQLPALGAAFIPHHELFNRARRHTPNADAAGAVARGETRAIDSFLDLERGDTVVHNVHGIGRFVGITRQERDGRRQEFLQIEFGEGVRVFVPASQIDQVNKYVGGGGEANPELSKVGSGAWEAKKAKVAAALEKLAGELVEVQALREQELGTAFPPDTPWQREFEAAFPFEDTPDQIDATIALKKDMERPKPMDRLLCGDVGYGKTELAMRAAFKAVMSGRQVCILVPTTVLAQQHFETFTERMAAYPVRIAALSRFQSKLEQRQVVEAVAAGAIDIVIGTHRLFSNDIAFKNLGLLVIDEEQRFGVEHKEKLKRLRATVDILTLTATPIPRTLHLALLGVRDISTLSTPPQGRRAIRTEVMRSSNEKVREALLRELDRDGQVFFVHNRVYDIESVERHLNGLVPEATTAVVHGQMAAEPLEERMLEFVEGKVDVLVTTTIIESGLDIPNANTILIDEADMYGLADLHQLRGRVGRSRHQAYALFLIPADRPVSHDAEKRLRAIEEFNELGAGFRIAMRDLEIRGAGNILGKEQSGHIAAVGYEMFCRMLEQAVRRARKQPPPADLESGVDFAVDAFIPEEYVPGDRPRIELYRRICRARTVEELAAVAAEIRDRFGDPPAAVRSLLLLAEVRVLASRAELVAVGQGGARVVARYRSRILAEKLKAKFPGRVRIVDDASLHIVPEPETSDPGKLLALVRETLDPATPALPPPPPPPPLRPAFRPPPGKRPRW
ncbi:MAG: transcription-repair coupling factor [Candidatus Brocadiae bacterium]|nr:transcription-repair coupling factor [Candidatus Brocadiia bacterium]